MNPAIEPASPLALGTEQLRLEGYRCGLTVDPASGELVHHRCADLWRARA
jgi:hypothetical protein